MGNYLANISIKTKILIMVAIPVLVFLTLSFMKFAELRHETTNAAELTALMDVSVAAGNLVHELQKERGMSAGYTNSKGKAFADALPKQRRNTDEKITVLKELLDVLDVGHLGKDYQNAVNDALSDLKQITDMRKKITDLRLPLPKVVGYYTNMNAKFLNITSKSVFIASDPQIIRLVSAYLNFSQSKERAGVERAVGAAGFGGGWTPALQNRMRGLIVIQDTYLNVFQSYADAKEMKFFAQASSDPSFAKVKEMRDIALSPDAVTGTSITAKTWFATITKKINKLKEIEDYLANDVIERAEYDRIKATGETRFYLILVIGLLLIVVIVTICAVRDLVKGIYGVEGSMVKLAEGDLETEISGRRRKDEIGSMSRALDVFKEKLAETKKLEDENKAAQARAEEERKKLMGDMATEFDSKVGDLIVSLASAANQLHSTAQSMRSISDETSKASQDVAAASEEAGTNVSTVAAAVEEMSASSSEISSQIQNTRNRSNDTAENAHGANETVSNLNELVGNIGEVVSAIRDIAEQTNLLALNATIEAARAGEAGKGFAVVAEEVKKLATETGQKTDEIEQRITEIQGATTESVGAMQKIIGNVEEINVSITAVAAAAEEQDQTCNEVSRNINEASDGVRGVTSIITEVQRASGEAGSSADAVLTASKEVAELSDGLKSSVAKFLEGLNQGK